MSEKKTDEVTGIDTTGHEWDGIRELDNPLPRWWLWTFLACIVWAFGYMVFYPAIPLVSEATPGVLGYSSRASVHQDIQEARVAQSEMISKVDSLALADIRNDADLLQFAINGGRAAYSVNCSQCHGSGAAGSPGYPNLNDDEWIWGGNLESIATTLQHGIRHPGDDDTRFSEMPAFGRDGILDKEQVKAVANRVLALAGQPHDTELATAGTELYADNCAACHGETGKGDREQGAPNLSDAIWLYGSSEAEIARQIHAPRHGVMPAWGDRLDPVTIKQLTIYVHSLGGGE
ncbi:MAG: cytochrome-c oxidase, cbb3-type subunit III [Minwuia sp.]|nr:cytochrome-c oxidase, cbb3-type subunit III [Minwuia sp.]